MKNSKRWLVFGVVLTVFSFLVFKLIFRFPFSADDYWHLWHAQSNTLQPSTFGPYMARVPLWCLTILMSFSSGFVSQENLIYLLGFGVNSACLMAIAWRMRGAFSGKETAFSWIFVAMCAIFSYFPNDHEILYWLTCWPYIGGLPFLVLGWWTSKATFKIILYVISFSFGEMFVLPALALELFAYFFNSPQERDIWQIMLGGAPSNQTFARSLRDDRRLFAKKVLVWILSVALFLMLRRLLAFEFGVYAHTLGQGLAGIPRQIQNMFGHFFVMSYYKTFWPPTLLYWIVGIVAMKMGLARQSIHWRQLLNTGAFVFLAGSLVFAMGYFAPRALYGASICVNALVIVLLERALSGVKQSRKIVLLVLLGCGFVGQSLLIYDLKDKNAYILDRKEQEIVNYLTTCADDCTIDVNAVSTGMKRGWVLHPDYVKPFVLWLAARHGIDKKIEFQGVPQELGRHEAPR